MMEVALALVSALVPALPPVHITGSIRTTKFFNQETEIESELKFILESNDLVESAKVSVTSIKTIESNYRRRESHELSENVVKIVEFIAACYIRNQTNLDTEAITGVQQSLVQSIENSGSFSSAKSSFVVEKPKVIKIKPLFIANETEVETKIGESIIHRLPSILIWKNFLKFSGVGILLFL